MRRSSVFAFLACFAASFGGAGFATAGEVVVLMSVRVDAYEDAARGFEASLSGHDIVKTHNMEGDFDRGRHILAKIGSGKKPDLIFAVGVWALQATLKDPPATPVVYAMDTLSLSVG